MKQQSFRTPSKKTNQAVTFGALVGGSLLWAASAQAGMVTDQNGNVGFDTAAECDAAVASGRAKFYQPFTSHPPLKRAGEASVKAMTLGEVEGDKYASGACDLGARRSGGRDGVSAKLWNKYVPFAPSMSVNVYFDAAGTAVRTTMKQCDNNFSGAFPRPVGNAPVAGSVSSECFATVQIPARFETKTEQVVKVPATRRYEVIPATYKAVTEQVMVAPEIKRQFPVPATYKEVSEQVLASPETFREEPIPATYKTVSEEVEVKPASSRIEITPGAYKTVTEQVMLTPERKELRVVPAVYADKEEQVEERPATTRVETIPATYKTETERVLLKAESLRYEPLVLPLRRVSERVVLAEASTRLETVKPKLRTVIDRVMVKEASKRLVEVPAVFETVMERVKIADATKEWKRGRAWIGQAINVRPLRGFVIGSDGRVDGDRVALDAAVGGRSTGVVDLGSVTGNNTNLDDDVMCLVEIPEQFRMVPRQVLKTAAGVREIEMAAEYATVTRQVLDTEAQTREIAIPATYQTVTRFEIDIEKLRAAGYKFDGNGDIVAMPNGDRVMRAATVMAGLAAGAGGKAGMAPVAATGADKSAGADSGEEGYVREIRTAAEYQTVSRQVVDRPASVRTVEVPGASKTVKTRVVVTPARTEEVVIPATYQTVSREVVAVAPSTREIPVPGVKSTVSRRVVDAPASMRKIPVPAVYTTVMRRVVDREASVREEVVPAVYRTVTRQVIDQPASTREIEVPAQYETLSNRVQVAPGSIERRAVLCETNATPAKIREIQQALKAAGYNPGPVNGVLRAATMSAVTRYQQAKSLPVDGFLNLETVKALGVSAN
ncbi:MAG: peptidoglycan-binding protein [Hydrogenophaga sp.]